VHAREEVPRQKGSTTEVGLGNKLVVDEESVGSALDQPGWAAAQAEVATAWRPRARGQGIAGALASWASEKAGDAMRGCESRTLACPLLRGD